MGVGVNLKKFKCQTSEKLSGTHFRPPRENVSVDIQPEILGDARAETHDEPVTGSLTLAGINLTEAEEIRLNVKKYEKDRDDLARAQCHGKPYRSLSELDQRIIDDLLEKKAKKELADIPTPAAAVNLTESAPPPKLSPRSIRQAI